MKKKIREIICFFNGHHFVNTGEPVTIFGEYTLECDRCKDWKWLKVGRMAGDGQYPPINTQ